MRSGVAAARVAIQFHVGWTWALVGAVERPWPGRLVILLLLQDRFPVVLDLGLVNSLRSCSSREEIAQVVVVRSVFEAEISHVRQVGLELGWEAFAQLRNWRCLFLLSNFLVLLLVGGGFQSLPWQTTPQEVHEHMAECLQIVTSRLLAPKMSVDTHVACCARKRLSLAVWDVLFRLRVAILLCHTKIHNMNYALARVLLVGVVAKLSNEEVVGLDVAVNEVLFVNSLDTGKLHHVSKLNPWGEK